MMRPSVPNWPLGRENRAQVGRVSSVAPARVETRTTELTIWMTWVLFTATHGSGGSTEGLLSAFERPTKEFGTAGGAAETMRGRTVELEADGAMSLPVLVGFGPDVD